MIRNGLFHVVYEYRNPIEHRQARVLLILNAVLLLFWTLWLAISFGGGNFDPTAQVASLLFFLGLPVLVIAVHILVQVGYLLFGALIFYTFTVAVSASTISAQIDTTSIVTIFIPLIVATIFLGKRGIFVTAVIMILFILVGAASQSELVDLPIESPADTVETDLAIASTILLMSAVFLYLFGDIHVPLIGQSLRNIRHLQLITTFGQRIDRTLEQSIYTTTIEFAREDLGYIFAQIFLADEGGKLTRRIRATHLTHGEQRFSTVSLNDASILMEAFRDKRTKLANLDTPHFRREHLLPAVNLGIAVPIHHNDEVLGIIDLQTTADEITHDELDVLRALADYIANLIIDVRTVQGLQQSLREQEEANINLRNQLRMYKQGGWLNPSDANLAWQASASSPQSGMTLGFNINARNNKLTPANDLPDDLRAVMEAGDIHTEANDEAGYTIYIPVTLRGDVLGAMTFKTDSPLTERQLEMAQSVANRLALALENVRLFEQSQTQATRERKASEATNLLLAATDIDAVLKLASNSFNDALGAINTRIQLQPEVIRDDIGSQSISRVDVATPESDIESPEEVDTP